MFPCGPVCRPNLVSLFSVTQTLLAAVLQQTGKNKNTEKLCVVKLHQLFMRPNMLVYMLMGPQAANNVMGWQSRAEC